MTFQESAQKILKEKGQPLDPKEIADIAFEKGIVKSKAKDQVRSFAETIKKNIRGIVYNVPELVIIKTPSGKFISLPGWDGNRATGEFFGFHLHPPLRSKIKQVIIRI